MAPTPLLAAGCTISSADGLNALYTGGKEQSGRFGLEVSRAAEPAELD